MTLQTTGRLWHRLLGAALLAALCAGCSSRPDGGGSSGPGQKDAPMFSLAWGDYPSWNVFTVASDLGLIDERKGHQGELEKKWGVDVELTKTGYDMCIQQYVGAQCDAVCLTNMDVLRPALVLPSVAVLPTSTSAGADALLVVDIDVSDKRKALQELKKVPVRGLALSVSEYVFSRNLELLGHDEKDFKYISMPPDLAAAAMQAGSPDVKAIMVWNPFLLQTEMHNRKAKRLFDSSTIPGEVVDMVVVSQRSLDRDGGGDFACCLIDTFYSFSRLLEDGEKRGDLVARLGKKFAGLSKHEMERALRETPFYKDARAGLELFTGRAFPEKNRLVSKFCLEHKIIDREPKLGYGGRDEAADAQLRFDPTYIRKVRDKP
jgi:ABC-type nitrate/sulfonate/bicarbonate transport system substrate-binding protein